MLVQSPINRLKQVRKPTKLPYRARFGALIVFFGLCAAADGSAFRWPRIGQCPIQLTMADGHREKVHELPPALIGAVEALRNTTGLLPVDSLMKIFADVRFVPREGTVLIAVPSLNYYEYLIPLVRPDIRVHVASRGGSWEMPKALVSKRLPQYVEHMYEEISASNPRLLEELEIGDVESLRTLIQSRVQFYELDATPEPFADLVVVRTPAEPLPNIEHLLKPGGFLWATLDRDIGSVFPPIYDHPWIDLNTINPGVALFGHRTVENPVYPEPVRGYTAAPMVFGWSKLFQLLPSESVTPSL